MNINKENGKDDNSLVWETINRLHNAVQELPELLCLLTAPLETLGLLPPQYTRYNTNPLPAGSVRISKHLPPLQRVLLEHVIPVWESSLKEKHL